MVSVIIEQITQSALLAWQDIVINSTNKHAHQHKRQVNTAVSMKAHITAGLCLACCLSLTRAHTLISCVHFLLFTKGLNT